MNYDDFVKIYSLQSKPAPESTWLFEALGVLLKRNLIEIGLVDNLFTGPTKWFWEKLKSIVEDTRKQYDYPQYAEHIEYLYNGMKKREQNTSTLNNLTYKTLFCIHGARIPSTSNRRESRRCL